MYHVSILTRSVSLANAVRRALPVATVSVYPWSAVSSLLEANPTSDLCILDGNPVCDEFREVLSQLTWRGWPCVAVGAPHSPTIVAETMRAGAVDYVPRPLTRQNLVRSTAVALSCRPRLASRAARQLAPEPIGRYRSSSMQSVLHSIAMYADSDAPILVTGESGVGKDLVARSIHARSVRSAGEFVVVNCGAVPDSLFEAELFGVRAGAYTGAVPRKGAFQAADRGTLFLDEIGELPIHRQVTLLRAIESGEIQPVGASRCRVVDVRIVAATNRDLRRDVQQRRFREDLYYRLNVLPLTVPPLRERTDDIPVLAAEVTEGVADSGYAITPDAIAVMRNLPWPGNVRQLRNIVRRSCALSENGLITAATLRMSLLLE